MTDRLGKPYTMADTTLTMSQCKKALRHGMCLPVLDGKDIGKFEEKEELTPSEERRLDAERN